MWGDILTYLYRHTNTPIAEGGTSQWGVDWFDLFWFFTNHHNIRIVVPIISKTLKNQQSGESTQELEPNNTSLNQCYVGIRISYRYLQILTDYNLGIYVLTQQGWKKNLKSGFGVEPWFSIFLKLKKKKSFSNCWFFASSFMETAGSLMFLK
jgi:hypothetical protein